MAVGIGFGREAPLRADVSRPLRFTAPLAFHPGAVWLAVSAPVLATVLLIVRLTA